jgi:hypothetical protein
MNKRSTQTWGQHYMKAGIEFAGGGYGSETEVGQADCRLALPVHQQQAHACRSKAKQSKAKQSKAKQYRTSADGSFILRCISTKHTLPSR